MKTLVTGGTGTLGRLVVPLLHEDGRTMHRFPSMDAQPASYS
jgi:uncharacterized protein YbjT (DUF2867 family)